MIPQRTVNLRNSAGNEVALLLRKYRAGDETGMIDCIKEEYGESYFKHNFYSPEYLKKEAVEGHITFLLAETPEGEAAGMMILKEFYPQESTCEIASQIFKKKYRGYGLAAPFFEYGMEILKSRSYFAAYCLPVLFHNVTQVLIHRMGLRAAGLVLNVFDMKEVRCSYQYGRNTKQSQGIQVMALKKRNAGILYLPPEHREFCRRIYESMGAGFYLEEKEDREIQKKQKAQEQISNITFQNDVIQSSLEIYIHTIGEDMEEQVDWILKLFPFEGRQTANIFLNCNDSNANWAYKNLKSNGYFFTGLKPLCSEKEYLVMHHPGKTEIFFEDYALSSEFSMLVDYINVCYKAQYGNGGERNDG